jgi:hypothetical protein
LVYQVGRLEYIQSGRTFHEAPLRDGMGTLFVLKVARMSYMEIGAGERKSLVFSDSCVSGELSKLAFQRS